MLRLRREYVASSAARDVVDMGIRRASGRVRHITDFFFFQAEDGIRDVAVTGVQTCALPICPRISYIFKNPRDMGIRLSYFITGPAAAKASRTYLAGTRTALPASSPLITIPIDRKSVV